jgi:hypothetical protein
MNVENKWRLFWFGKHIETLLVLSIISVGALFIVAASIDLQNAIKCCVMAVLFLSWAYLIHLVTQQPKDKF